MSSHNEMWLLERFLSSLRPHPSSPQPRRDSSTSEDDASHLPQASAPHGSELQGFSQKNLELDMTHGVIQVPKRKRLVTQFLIDYTGHSLSGKS